MSSPIKLLKKKIYQKKRRMRSSLNYIAHHPLTKDHQMAARIRYIAFHLKQFMIGNKPAVYHFIENIHFYASIGEAGIVGNIYTGLADFEEMAFLLHFLNPDDLFIDIGANVGAYTLLASGVCKSNSIAIEPIPATFKRLQRNINLNNLEHRVSCLNFGMGNEETFLYFTDTPHSVMNRVVPINAPLSSKHVKIKVIPLDMLLQQYQTPSLVKIDVEGYEMEVLKGASVCLQHYNLKAIIIELNQSGIRYGTDDKDVIDYLAAAGFFPCTYDPFFHSISITKKKNSSGFNTNFIRALMKSKGNLKKHQKRRFSQA